MSQITKKVKFFFIQHWPLVIIFLYAVVPILWFKNGYLLAGGDEISYLNPGNSFSLYLYSWLSKFNAGGVNISFCSVFPYKFFWFLLQNLGLPNLFIQKIWVVLLFIAPGISMYFLTRYLLKGFQALWVNFAALTSATFYMFNIYVTLFAIQSNTRLVQFGLPLCLLFWMKALNLERCSLKYPILIGLVSVLFISSNSNLPLVLMVPFTLFLYSVFFLLVKKGKWGHIAKYTILTIAVYLLFNSWWIANLFIIRESGWVDETKLFVQRTNFWANTPLWESIRLMGFWAFRSFSDGKPAISFSENYYKSPLLIFSYLIPVLIFSLIFIKKRAKESFFFFYLALIGIFLTKGTRSPFGSFYFFLVEKFPSFWIFREPFAKFTLLHLLSYSILLGYLMASTCLLKKFRTKTSLLLFFSVMLIIFINSYPLIMGEIFNVAGTRNSRYSKIPFYWEEISQWFKKNDPYSRILVLPKAEYGLSYNWDFGIGGSTYVSDFLLNNPQIRYRSNSNTRTDQAIDDFFNTFSLKKTTDLKKYFKIFNIKYALFQGDLALENREALRNSWSKILEENGVKKIKSFGPLDLYEKENFADTPFILGNTAVDEGNTPVFTFKKINPTSYEIVIKNANSPYFINFLESYNKYWKLKIIYSNGEKFILPDSLHLTSFGYANSWFIDRLGEYKIIIYYEPQIVIFILLIVSILTAFLSVIYLICNVKNKLLHRKLTKYSDDYLEKPVSLTERCCPNKYWKLRLLSKGLYSIFAINIVLIIITVINKKENLTEIFGQTSYCSILLLIFIETIIFFCK